mmetsp:Transcript_70065/g.196070  ORF Transcript_70065/g.196070 Transcript_70065/m.196070 type:complete len:378 (+) Transcript_70065:166-1299(+)
MAAEVGSSAKDVGEVTPLCTSLTRGDTGVLSAMGEAGSLPLLGFLTMSCLSEISLIFPLRLENSSLGCRSSGTAPSAESARGLVRALFGLAVPRCSFATSRSLALSLLTSWWASTPDAVRGRCRPTLTVELVGTEGDSAPELTPELPERLARGCGGSRAPLSSSVVGVVLSRRARRKTFSRVRTFKGGERESAVTLSEAASVFTLPSSASTLEAGSLPPMSDESRLENPSPLARDLARGLALGDSLAFISFLTLFLSLCTSSWCFMASSRCCTFCACCRSKAEACFSWRTACLSLSFFNSAVRRARCSAVLAWTRLLFSPSSFLAFCQKASISFFCLASLALSSTFHLRFIVSTSRADNLPPPLPSSPAALSSSPVA